MSVAYWNSTGSNGRRKSDIQGFILLGDLFKTGGCHALAELTGQGDDESKLSGVALGEWMAGGDEDLPATRPSHPFELRDLSRDGVPEVAIAGPASQYFQENHDGIHEIVRRLPAEI